MIMWYHVETGQAVHLGGRLKESSAVSMDLKTNANSHEEKSMLITSTADSMARQASTDTLLYRWEMLGEGLWIRGCILKTNGAFCMLAAALNGSLLADNVMLSLFNDTSKLHLSSGVMGAHFLFKTIQEKDTGIFAFCFEKCTKLQSFLNLFDTIHNSNNEFVYIVCYTTRQSTTHAICWDFRNKLILDSDYQNPLVFKYSEFHTQSSEAVDIMNALHTTIDEPCILYVAYWKKKVRKKRKR